MITMCTLVLREPGRRRWPRGRRRPLLRGTVHRDALAVLATAGAGTPSHSPARGPYPSVVANPTSLLKRLLLGRPFRSDRLQHTLLPKRIALPVFASDALSSVAYAPDEILLTLSIAGAAAYVYSPWVALAVVVVMLTVVASYRQNVHAYPSGGGDYEVATRQPRPAVRARGGQRAAGRLRAHGGGLGLLGRGEPRLGRAVRGRAQGGHRGRRGGRC